MKWVWITPIYWDNTSKDWKLSESETYLNLDRVRHINKDKEGKYFTIWLSESSQDIFMVNRDGFNAILEEIKK